MAKTFADECRRMAVIAQYDARKLARLWDRSTRQLQRDFKRETGSSPQAWLDKERMLAARQLLLARTPVKNVALELGFKQCSHFSRRFKLYHNINPSKWADSGG